MSRFNMQSEGIKTINLAGGKAYEVNPKFELISILTTSFLKDKYYRGADSEMSRVVELTKEMPEFAAKASIWARRELGMRSITHVVAGEIGKLVKGQKWTKHYFERIVRRPDDMLEILSYYWKDNKNAPIPMAMRKGFKRNLESMNENTMAKYKASSKDLKMVDLVNLLHPKATTAITKLVKGELKGAETWEVGLSQAGQKGNEEETTTKKKEVWIDLVTNKKLKYLALLRNIRNISEQAPEVFPEALNQLQNLEEIKRNLILPFQFLTAVEVLETNREAVQALSKAMTLALSNVPAFDGRTLIVVDTSGSMDGDPIKKASIFASALYKSNFSDLMLFNTEAKFIAPDPEASVLSISQYIQKEAIGGGTDFEGIFHLINKTSKIYNRIVILSDMQGWIQGGNIAGMYRRYKSLSPHSVSLYSWDLQGYGTAQFPEQDVFCLAGWSEKIFDIMKLLEEDKNTLIKVIERYEIN